MSSWWRHQMEAFSALLAICEGNSPVAGEFPTQRPVTRSFDVYFDPRLNKRLSKQSSGWWFETLSRPFWRHSNEMAQQPASLRHRLPYQRLAKLQLLSYRYLNCRELAEEKQTSSADFIWVNTEYSRNFAIFFQRTQEKSPITPA